MHTKDYYINGVLPVAIASLVWGGGYFIRKIVLPEVHALILTFFTLIIVALVFGIFTHAKFHKIWSIFSQHPGSYLALSFSGLLAMCCMYLGLARLDLGLTVVLEKLQPLFVILLAFFLLSEKIPTKKYSHMLLALVASYFVTTPNPNLPLLEQIDVGGILFIVLAAFFYAAANVIGKHMMNQNKTPHELILIRFSIGVVCLLPVFLLRDQLGLHMNLSLSVGMLILIAALFSTCTGYFLYYSGLKYTSASTASFLELITPITAIVLGITFLGETLSTTQIIAIPVMLGAVYKITQPDHG